MKLENIRRSLGLTALLTLLLCLAAARGEGALSPPDTLTAQALANATRINLSEHQGLVISRGGTYVLSGSMTGQLSVQADKEDQVHLVLDNASIKNPLGPAIYGLRADRVTITLMAGSQNTLEDGEDYSLDEEGANAAIYTKTDLILSGQGALTVRGQTAHGILSRDALSVTGGSLNITAPKDGLRGKDSVTVSGGSLNIEAGSDGIIATDNDLDKGWVRIEGGAFVITAGRDAIQAENELTIAGGSFHITTGDGGTSPPNSSPGGFSGSGARGAETEDSPSIKGLKAGKALALTGGTFVLNTQDDAIHSDGDITITGGSYAIQTGDDAIHADGGLHIIGGDILVTGAYEGLEGKTITIDGGNIQITATDDGINAASSEEQDDETRPRGRMSPEEGVRVIINAGTIKVTAGADAIDSNGTITINGGQVDLTTLRPGRGTLALDANGPVEINGGQVTTNDGSHNAIPRR